MTEQARTERGLDRLVNFSDATVAIALTIQILPLVDLAPELTNTARAYHRLRERWPARTEFFVTFSMIASFCTGDRRQQDDPRIHAKRSSQGLERSRAMAGFAPVSISSVLLSPHT